MKKITASMYLMTAWLTLLVTFACYLAANRMYQVDEAQNVFMMRVLGTHQASAYFTNPLLWMLGPLAWGAASSVSSVSLFFSMRMIFLLLFFANILLIGLNTGVRLQSGRGFLVLCGAATLAPLWDYGFEIRHDNLILMGLLLMWWLGRTSPRGRWSYGGLGFLAVLLLFTAFKSFVYVIPICLVFLGFPAPGQKGSRLSFGLAFLVGACVGAMVVSVAYGVSGFWPLFVVVFKTGMHASEGGARFGSGLALGRLLDQTPLVLGLSVGSLVALAGQFSSQGWRALTWGGWLPEAILTLGAVGILLINPTPFPYNLVNLIPFAYLLAARFLLSITESAQWGSTNSALFFSVICFTHLVPFATATRRHFDWRNDRQETLMATAEALTDPVKDRVYDAIGMVPMRQAIGYHWFLHSLNLQDFATGRIPSVSRKLQENPPAVIIKSYRTDWLPEADQRFIQGQYVPIADDFWVLGKVLPPGGGDFDVIHEGRYQLLGLDKGKLVSLPSARLDGCVVSASPVLLHCGAKKVTTPPGVQAVVIWVGPRLNNLPLLSPGDHLRLFVNWY